MTLTEVEENEYLQLLELEVASRSMREFVPYTFRGYEPNWHHELICDVLDRFVHTDEIPRLMIFAPPRHGKSELVSRRLPAYIFGQNPDSKIIACSYSADLSSMLNRDVQRIMESDEYRALFPSARLSSSNGRTTGSYLKNSDIFELVGRSGAYRSAGVGGGITGMGCSVLIIDDPIKNKEEADSATHRQKIWEWYTTTAYTRLEKNGKIVLMLTRWHEDDLAGRLLDQAKKDPSADQWHVVTLPAIAENPAYPGDPRRVGEALWPDKYSIQRLAKMRSTVGPRTWAALFQQRPRSPKGGVLKRINWRFYETMPTRFDRVIQSWDMSFKDEATSDYVAGQVWGKVGSDFYLLDYFKEQLSFTGSLRALRQLSIRWPQAHTKVIEDKANGTAIVDHLQLTMPGLQLVNPRGGKVARVNAISPVHEAQHIHLPMPSRFLWVNEFIENCANFPNVTHDDDIDAMSQAILYMNGDPLKRLTDLLKD